ESARIPGSRARNSCESRYTSLIALIQGREASQARKPRRGRPFASRSQDQLGLGTALPPALQLIGYARQGQRDQPRIRSQRQQDTAEFLAQVRQLTQELLDRLIQS